MIEGNPPPQWTPERVYYFVSPLTANIPYSSIIETRHDDNSYALATLAMMTTKSSTNGNGNLSNHSLCSEATCTPFALTFPRSQPRKFHQYASHDPNKWPQAAHWFIVPSSTNDPLSSARTRTRLYQSVRSHRSRLCPIVPITFHHRPFPAISSSHHRPFPAVSSSGQHERYGHHV